jgi:hypothetical protein
MASSSSWPIYNEMKLPIILSQAKYEQLIHKAFERFEQRARTLRLCGTIRGRDKIGKRPFSLASVTSVMSPGEPMTTREVTDRITPNHAHARNCLHCVHTNLRLRLLEARGVLKRYDLLYGRSPVGQPRFVRLLEPVGATARQLSKAAAELNSTVDQLDARRFQFAECMAERVAKRPQIYSDYQKMVELRLQGVKLRVIAERFGISHERVRQVVARAVMGERSSSHHKR